MRVLHLLSQRELTGAETYALGLARHHARLGIHCVIASDRLNVPCEFAFYPVPLGDRRWRRRCINVLTVARIVRKENIDVLHAHSRAASWIANLVAALMGTAYVSTVHGRQSMHFTSQHFNVYGRHIVAVCPHLVEHLADDLNIPAEYVRFIPNGI